uniref:Putative ankyrin-repeat containing protein n=1 Tax=Fusarium heterosporum TaxID=42747 RepID=S0AT33_FUSHE|nr:putative ankyrin-repeat containing protein [Fusarium heterosporum]
MVSNNHIAQSASDLEDALDTLFNRILKQLAETDVFSKAEAPSLFVVYAHENKAYGTANASCVIELIKWLQDIRSRTVSDRAPLPLLYSRTGGSESVRNILSNQFCLLPEKDASSEDGTVHRVDKVIVCGSEVLRRYYRDPFTTPYLDAVKKAYEDARTQSSPMMVTEQTIRDVVEAHCKNPHFHHVITELAFLELRSTHHKEPNSIIPLALDEDLMEWLPFRDNCDLVTKLKSTAKLHRHQLFFKLLNQIYSEEHLLINHFKDCYDTAADQLQNVSPDMVCHVVDSQISKTQRNLADIENAALRGRRRDMDKIESTKAHHETIRDVQQDLKSITADVEARSHDKRFTEIANWLSASPYWLHHQSVSDKVMSGSCSWILDHPNYTGWLDSKTSSTLLVQGREDKLSVAYYYCSNTKSEPDRANPNAILRSILFQVAVNRATGVIDPIIISEYEKLDNGGPNSVRLGAASCLRLLQQLQVYKTTIIALDAIDELAKPDRAELIQALERLVEDSQGIIKLFITSRIDVHVEKMLPAALTIEVSSHLNNKDIVEFVDMKLASAVRSRTLLLGNVSHTLYGRIREALLAGAQEMFLWIELQLELLTRKEAEMDVIKALDAGLATNLDRLYDETFKSVLALDNTAKTIVKGIFCWVLYAKCPLTIGALSNLLRLHLRHSQEVRLPDVSAVCLNLVVIDAATQTLRFCHPSARDYMRGQEMFSELIGNRFIAEACLRQCSQGPGPVPLHVSALNTIQDPSVYTGLYWPQHLAESESGDQSPSPLIEPLRDFVEDEDEEGLGYAFIWWLDWIKGVMKILPQYHPLKMTHECILSDDRPSATFTVAVFGLRSLMNLLIDQGTNLNLDEKSNTGHTALYLACLFGHSSVATSLLGLGADASIVCGSFGNALQAASFRGHVDVVEALLKHGVSPKPGAPPFKNALDAACEASQTQVALLLVTKSSLIEKEYEYDEALQMATDSALFEVVEYLAKPSVARSFGRNTANTEHEGRLVLAMIKKGRVDGLRSLLASQSAMRNWIPDDAIATAALRGHGGMIDLLCEFGLDLEAEGKYGSPLRSASLQGDLHIVKRLLELGASPTAKYSKGDALQAACSQGHIAIVQLLISRNADVNQQGPPRGSPIQAAAWYGHQAAVELLIDENAQIYCETYKFKDALHAAAKGGHDEIASFLLENYPPPPGTVLPAVARGDHRDKFWFSESGPTERRLRDGSPHPEDTDEEDEGENAAKPEDDKQPDPTFSQASQNPLVLASSIGNIATIRQELQAQEVDQETISEAFVIAAANGKLEAIKVLIEYGLRHVDDITSPKEDGLIASLRYKQTDSYDLLLESLGGGVSVVAWCRALKDASSVGTESIKRVIELDILPWTRESAEELAIPLRYGNPDHVYTNPVPACGDIIEELYSSGWKEPATMLWHWLFQRGPQALNVVHKEWESLLHVAARYADATILDGCCALQGECFDSLYHPKVSSAELLSSVCKGKNDATFDHLLHLARQESCSEEQIMPAYLEACVQGYTHAVLELCRDDGDPFIGFENFNLGIVSASRAGHAELVVKMINPAEDESVMNTIETALLSAAGAGKIQVITKILEGTEIRSVDDFEYIMDRILITACETGHLDIVELCLNEGAEVDSTVARAPSTMVPAFKEDEPQLRRGSLGARPVWLAPPVVHRYPRPAQAAFAEPGLVEKEDDDDDAWEDDEGSIDEAEDVEQDQGDMTDALQASILAFRRILRYEGMPGFDFDPSEWAPRAMQQLSVVLLILENAPSLHIDTKLPTHPLRLAVEFATDEVVKGLLDNGAADGFSSDQLKDIMLVAAERRILIGARIILEILTCDRQLTVPINYDNKVHPAILELMRSIIESLYDPYARRDICSKNGMIPSEKVAKAYMNGGLQQLVSAIFRKLPGQTANDGVFGDVLHVAAAAGDLATVKLLIKHRVDVNHLRHYFHTPLGAAAEFGHCQVLKALLRARAHIHPKCMAHGLFGNQEPAMKAIVGGQIQALKTLADSGFDPNVDAGDTSLLVFAVESKIAGMVKVLLEAGAKPDDHPLALVTAAHYGDLEMVRYLLDAGANPSSLAIYGKTLREEHLCSPLYIACENGRADVVDLLLERGANATDDSGDRDGLSLVVAARGGYVDIVKALLGKGCCPTQRSRGLDGLCQKDKNAFARQLQMRDRELQYGGPSTRGPPSSVEKASTESNGDGFLDAIEAACAGVLGIRTSSQIVRTLLDAINDPETKHRACLEALQHVSQIQNSRLFEELVDLVPLDTTILELACRCGSKSVVEKIVHQENLPTTDIKALLELAVVYEHMNLILFLVEECMQQDSVDLLKLVASILEAYAWSTAAKHKSIARCEETVDSLLRLPEGLSSNQEDLDRALTVSCYIGSVKVASTLIQLGARPDAQAEPTQIPPSSKSSPLLACVAANHPGVLKAIIGLHPVPTRFARDAMPRR